MFSGALIRLPEEIDINRLDGLRWERRQGGQDLKSVMQFQGSIIRSGDIEAKEALAIHESPGKQAIIDESEGKYKISYIDVVNTVWANIYVVPGFVVVDSLENRSFVRDIINKGLNPPKRAHDVVLNTAKMAEDHAGQWVRSFAERRGRVDRGTVFGGLQISLVRQLRCVFPQGAQSVYGHGRL